jgi:transaldolase/glucose-6-phosphate isomerase
VLTTLFGAAPGALKLRILDSTDPAQVRAAATAGRLSETLVVVASKSGSTLEPHCFLEYFWDLLQDGRRFVAITDPGSKLEALARQRGFRAIFHGEPEIGGRYSVLSRFGLVPASLLGVDLAAFLGGAQEMADACRCAEPGANPGLELGLILGCSAIDGRDKLTIVTSPALWDVGAWIEQLVAESTGKNGRAIVPVDGEPLGPPAAYGDDRLFVYLELEGDERPETLLALAALAEAGHPVVRLRLADRGSLGAEFFRWEFATAVAGAVLGIHPFDQPDVEASKVETRHLTEAAEAAGALPQEVPFLEQGGLRFFADPVNTAALAPAPGETAAGLLRRHFARASAGDYVALLAYLEMRGAHRRPLEAMRLRLRDRLRLATCLGFGPRFLHSTGQAYKGGPNSGVFLQITCDDARDLAVPGRVASFGMVKAAQARGDFAVLAERGRRALRVHLGTDVERGLAQLSQVLEEAV